MYKKDYAYKKLKRPEAFLKHIEDMNLVSMTISLSDYNNQQAIKPTYLISQPKFDKDNFNNLMFSTFSNQQGLINFLNDNASGTFSEVEPLTFVAERGLPSFMFRKFTFNHTNYVLAHISDCGLVYHILFGNHGFKMPIGLANISLTDSLEIYKLIELINYGLIGRNLSFNLSDGLSVGYEYDPEQTVMTYSQFPKEALVEARIRYFNQSASLNNQLGYWDKVTVESDETSIKDFKTGQGLPKFKLTFYHKDSSLALSYMWLS